MSAHIRYTGQVSMCILFLSCGTGCQESLTTPSTHLNRYSYVVLPSVPALMQSGKFAPMLNVTESDNRNFAAAIKEALIKSFAQEGVRALSDYSWVDGMPPADKLQVLRAQVKYEIAWDKSSATLLLYDYMDRQVYMGTGKCQLALTLQDYAVNAVTATLKDFSKLYSGFDAGLVDLHIDELTWFFRDWPHIDANEATLREYFGNNVSSLDPIEGIWMLDMPAWPRLKLGIARDSEKGSGDFRALRLEDSGPIWRPGDVFADIQKTANDGRYVASIHQRYGRQQSWTAILTPPSNLEFALTDLDTATAHKISCIRLYPLKDTIAAAPQPAPATSRPVCYGTCFSVSDEGLLVTAYHVVSGATVITIYLGPNECVTAQVIQVDPVNDFAVLRISRPTPEHLQLGSAKAIKMGDKVFTIGFPVSPILGRNAKYAEGVISSLSGLHDAASLIQVTVPVQPGNSGGPLLTEEGLVVGMMTSTAAIGHFFAQTGTLPQNVNWAVKTDYLLPLLETTPAEPVRRSKEHIIEQVQGAVFLVAAE